jgi:hypothetical protein
MSSTSGIRPFWCRRSELNAVLNGPLPVFS